MLLTITYAGENASDLGFLLHKNPYRPQVFDMNFGKAYVFYPEIEDNKCTAALLLDIDPLDLARGKVGSKEGGLFDYVNDRPYVVSSFMSTAIARIFGTAMTGRCDKRQQLADTELDLSAAITMLPCRGGTAMLERVFVPLGYKVEFETDILDEAFPEWGESCYVNLTISGQVQLKDLLHHLYVLIPVFDRKKHYWIGKDEIEKLLRHGEGWLEEHPEKEFITRRYFARRRGLARLALDRLDDGEAGAQEEASEEFDVRAPNLNTQRLEAVVQALKEKDVKTVIDLGCGEGNLLHLLLKDKSFTQIAGVDVSPSVLERAAGRLKLDTMPEIQKNRITLFQSSLTYKDDRFSSYDAAAAIEVIEHMDLNRLAAFAQVLFGQANSATIVVTTPNMEYNYNYERLHDGSMRHGDHRFEWTRQQFQDWANETADKFGYTVSFQDIGEADEEHGSPTQMGVFTKCV